MADTPYDPPHPRFGEAAEELGLAGAGGRVQTVQSIHPGRGVPTVHLLQWAWEATAVTEQPRYLTTGAAADALGVARNTLWSWHQRGWVKPAFITAGGQLRWDLDDLRQQVAALNERPEEGDRD